MEARYLVGRRIAAAREYLGLNQTDLATRANLTQSAVSRIEDGKVKVDFFDLIQLANALDRPLSYFLESIAEYGEGASSKTERDRGGERANVYAPRKKR